MEPAAAIAVDSAPVIRGSRPARGHHRRAACSPSLRLRLVTVIADAIYARKLRAEDIRILLGESEGGLGSLRREVADLRSRRTTIGFERLLVFCEALGVDPEAAFAGAAAEPRRYAA